MTSSREFILSHNSGRAFNMFSNENIQNFSQIDGKVEEWKKEVGFYESKLDLIEFGVYEPVYDFEKSDDYRAKQKRIIQLQNEMKNLFLLHQIDVKKLLNPPIFHLLL